MATSTEVYEALKLRYPAPGYALFFELANGVGSVRTRYCDAFVMSLFPSRGLDIHGFEVKVERSDWLREMRNPEKADEIAAYCDYCWLVIGDKSIAKLEEVPRTWGLLCLEGRKLVTKKRPELLKAKAFDRPQLASLLRRCNESIDRQILNSDAIQIAEKRGFEQGQMEEQKVGKVREYEALKEAVDRFERNSGVQIHDRWSGGDIGKAVKTLLWIREHETAEVLQKLVEALNLAKNDLDNKIEAIKALETDVSNVAVRDFSPSIKTYVEKKP